MATKSKRKKAPPPKKICVQCKLPKRYDQFYKATNPITAGEGNTVNICKDCIRENSTNEDGSLNIEKFKQMLMVLDKPYIPQCLNMALKEIEKYNSQNKTIRTKQNVVGVYFKNIASLPQYSKLSYNDSLKLEDVNVELEQIPVVVPKEKFEEAKIRESQSPVYSSQIDDFIVTQEIIDTFGEGLHANEYRLMWNKYQQLTKNYYVKTTMHQEFLIDYVKCKVKQELAIIKGDIASVEKWGKLASSAAEQAKMTPKQLSAEDLQDGVNSFSEIFETVEGAVDIIKILPQFVQQPNDMPDFIIWNYINYERDLNGLPKVAYEDIYYFYDKEKENYLKEQGDPFGIFKNDLSQDVQKRQTVQKFITVAKEQIEDDEQ